MKWVNFWTYVPDGRPFKGTRDFSLHNGLFIIVLPFSFSSSSSFKYFSHLNRRNCSSSHHQARNLKVTTDSSLTTVSHLLLPGSSMTSQTDSTPFTISYPRPHHHPLCSAYMGHSLMITGLLGLPRCPEDLSKIMLLQGSESTDWIPVWLKAQTLPCLVRDLQLLL